MYNACISIMKEFHNKLASKDKKPVLIENRYHALITALCFQDKWDILIDWLKKSLNS